jgi:hypothetical protein
MKKPRASLMLAGRARRKNPFMTPATPALVRPNPFKMGPKVGRVWDTMGGASLAVTGDVIWKIIAPPSWYIAYGVGRAALSLLPAPGPLASSFGGASFYGLFQTFVAKAVIDAAAPKGPIG